MLETILKALPYVVYALLAGYLLAWCVLLVGCLRRRRYWPVLGTDRQTRWFWLATFVFLNPFLTGMYYVFGHRRAPDAKAGRIGAVQVALTVAVVAIAGFFVKVPPIAHLWMVPLSGWSQAGPGKPSGIRSHAATIEARSSSSATTVSSSSDNTRLACRRLAVIVEDSHALTAQIGATLREALGRMPAVAEAVLLPDGHFPPDGQVRPDLFVRLTCRNVRITPVPYVVTLRAEIDVSAGRSPWRDTSSYHDGSDPPILDFAWTATIRHESRTTGYESVPHGLASKDISKTIAKDLRKLLAKWLAAHGPVPAVDKALMGTYRKAALPEALRTLGARRVCSYRGLLTHNETFWRVRVPAEGVAERIEGLSKALAADGWQQRSRGEARLRMNRGTTRIHVYRLRRRVQTGWVPAGGAEAGQSKTTLIVRLLDRFSDDERRAALDGLLAGPVPTDTLLFFSRLFDDDQRSRMVERFERRPGVSLPAQVYLVNHYLGRKEYDKVAAGLRRARALLRGVWEQGKSQSKLDEAAKKLARATGLDKPPKPSPPTAEDFGDAGFAILDANTPSFEQEVGLGEPAALACEGDKGLRTLVLRVIESTDEAQRTPHAWECVEALGQGSRSRSVQPGTVGNDGMWSASHTSSFGSGPHIRARVNALPTAGRFVVKVWTNAPPAR